ncbi:MAG: DUF5008 domain-containing protein [Bacteroidota bacterium]
MKLKYTGLLFAFMAATVVSSCKSTTDDTFENPYAGGQAALGIKSNQQQVPVPSSGQAGTVVSIAATGLVAHKDKLTFLFNGQKAEIVEVTDAGIKVKVPGRASSGVTSFVVDGQLVFGPPFTVLGKVNKDFTYKVVNGTNGTVLKAIETTGGNIVLLGDFTNYDNKGIVKEIRRIVRTLPDGTYDRSLQSGSASNGALYDMAIVNGLWYIAGRFSGYAQRDGISNIARLSSQGQIDTVQVPTYENKTKFVSRFNGGTNGTIVSVYPTPQNQLIITGDFGYYFSRRYDQPSYQYKDSVVVDSIDVRQLAKLNLDGSLDKTWRFDKDAIGYKGLPGKSLPGANGPIQTLMHSDGKILVYGRFTKFDDASVGSIIRLNADGTIDPTFNAGRSGSTDFIGRVSYNAKLNKYLAVGSFSTFNGTKVNSMVLLNYDGSIDPSFTARVFEGGYPYFVKLLDDGLGVVSGDFKTYDGVARNRFMITDIKGDLADGYNTIGNLGGGLQDVFETKSADGKRALLLMGSFYLFDNLPANNIVRVTLD